MAIDNISGVIQKKKLEEFTQIKSQGRLRSLR